MVSLRLSRIILAPKYLYLTSDHLPLLVNNKSLRSSIDVTLIELAFIHCFTSSVTAPAYVET